MLRNSRIVFLVGGEQTATGRERRRVGGEQTAATAAAERRPATGRDREREGEQMRGEEQMRGKGNLLVPKPKYHVLCSSLLFLTFLLLLPLSSTTILPFHNTSFRLSFHWSRAYCFGTRFLLFWCNLEYLFKGKMDSIQRTSISANDTSLRPETDFMELVWENGQIMMQGPSKKGHISDSFHTLPPKINDTRNSNKSKMSKFSMVDSTMSADFQLPVPSCDIELDDDVVDIVPWLNYPSIEDSLPNDYDTSDFLRELSGVTMNDLSTNNHLASKEKRISFQDNGYSSVIENTSKAPEKRISSPEKHISSLSNITSNRINSLDFIHNPSSLCAFTSLRLQKLEAIQPSNNTTTSSGFTNFPCFSRHAALSRKLCNGNLEPCPEKPTEEVLSSKDKLRADVAKNDANCAPVGKPEIPVVVAASSVCSGNSVERASNELKRDLKRKSRDTGDSEDPNEEVEEESANARKFHRGRGSLKRTRAAEVHNLSERRRRDRINEKMRSLQELIPNCNKVDKASMLDEAIEYLKTLQLQVQMLAMGSGMYMPPMMLPPIHGGHMPHFSPMGVGMGLGFNMMDMNSCMKMIPFQGPHYPIPNLGPAFPGMPGSIFQGFGQGLPMPMQVQPPVLPASGVPSLNIPKESVTNPAPSSKAMLR